ncbi:manganese catalase family protein [Halobacillus massiliensis]|uniref:manganese catalase family protein n=1 Tax=Halobacillus massiliensis TaxID=1926286 RepID=UPI0009E4A872|nr:manganese catalase family protein [Halobacillus massiliensis]
MWIYEKKLQFPIDINRTDIKMAKLLYEAYGGQDGPLTMGLSYLNQRYTVKDPRVIALLTDIGTEEMAHLEIIASLIFNLSKDATPQQFKEAGMGSFYASHDSALAYTNSSGVPWSAMYTQTSGDLITDLKDNIAAEERAHSLYQRLIDLTDNPDLHDVLLFLLERSVIHGLRFREALKLVSDGYYNDSQV